jgi:four helix bundle protein
VKGVVLDQFKRAMISISLNIAEGAGKHYGKDQAKFYDVARGSALESGACLDVLVAMQIVSPIAIQSGKDFWRKLSQCLRHLPNPLLRIESGKMRRFINFEQSFSI